MLEVIHESEDMLQKQQLKGSDQKSWAMGGGDFEATEPCHQDRFFREALGLPKVPSSAWGPDCKTRPPSLRSTMRTARSRAARENLFRLNQWLLSLKGWSLRQSQGAGHNFPDI